MASLKARESSQQPEAESGTTEGGKAEEHAQRQQRVASHLTLGAEGHRSRFDHHQRRAAPTCRRGQWSAAEAPGPLHPDPRAGRRDPSPRYPCRESGAASDHRPARIEHRDAVVGAGTYLAKERIVDRAHEHDGPCSRWLADVPLDRCRSDERRLRQVADHHRPAWGLEYGGRQIGDTGRVANGIDDPVPRIQHQDGRYLVVREHRVVEISAKPWQVVASIAVCMAVHWP